MPRDPGGLVEDASLEQSPFLISPNVLIPPEKLLNNSLRGRISRSDLSIFLGLSRNAYADSYYLGSNPTKFLTFSTFVAR